MMMPIPSVGKQEEGNDTALKSDVFSAKTCDASLKEFIEK